MPAKQEIKERIKERYGKIALTGNSNSCRRHNCYTIKYHSIKIGNEEGFE
jgi:hypothetical protein